jgi:Nuclear transport factor 2 (NTF2) domain
MYFFKNCTGGIILMVTGAITLSGQSPRQFAQTFFLALQKQPNDKHNFYVLNDIFRLLDTIPSVVEVSFV